MKIESIELRTVALPLKYPFRTSFGTEYDKEAMLVRVVATSGIAAWPIVRKSPGCNVVLPITPSIGARTTACSRSSLACASCASASL